MRRNLGETRLRRSRRPGDPMAAFDALPEPLRKWLAQAAMPWSPSSVRKIWVKSLRAGKSPDEVLRSLSELEGRNLARERLASARASNA